MLEFLIHFVFHTKPKIRHSAQRSLAQLSRTAPIACTLVLKSCTQKLDAYTGEHSLHRLYGAPNSRKYVGMVFYQINFLCDFINVEAGNFPTVFSVKLPRFKRSTGYIAHYILHPLHTAPCQREWAAHWTGITAARCRSAPHQSCFSSITSPYKPLQARNSDDWRNARADSHGIQLFCPFQFVCCTVNPFMINRSTEMSNKC